MISWENFYSQFLKYPEVTHCPLTDLKAHFPNLISFSINARMNAGQAYEVGGDYIDLSRHFLSLTTK